jgi:ribosomal protein S18 acetylase RimI-like enzyme
MSDTTIDCTVGIHPDHLERAADIIETAFAAELSSAIPNAAKRKGVLVVGLNPSMLIGACAVDQLVGVAGLRTSAASVLDGMTFAVLRRNLGADALRATLAIRLLEVPIPPGTLHLEFLAVDPAMRGHGVGSSLLDALAAHACSTNAGRLQLHVDEQNMDAIRLYQRHGFATASHAPLPRLNRMLGVNPGMTMEKETSCTTS